MSDFENAAAALRSEDKAAAIAAISDEKKLEIYALFKQGSVGNVNTDRPGMMDFKGKAKWDAWKAKEGMSQEDAQQAYVDLVKELELI